MGAVTYPNPAVQEEIDRYFVPVQFNVVEQPEVMDRFTSTWTPTIIIQDADGVEHRRSQGYLDPDRFLAELALGRMKAAIDAHDFTAAAEDLHEVKARTAHDPFRAPEAAYWAAVIAYKTTDDPAQLATGFNHLLDAYPDSEWARKASFIRD